MFNSRSSETRGLIVNMSEALFNTVMGLLSTDSVSRWIVSVSSTSDWNPSLSSVVAMEVVPGTRSDSCW